MTHGSLPPARRQGCRGELRKTRLARQGHLENGRPGIKQDSQAPRREAPGASDVRDLALSGRAKSPTGSRERGSGSNSPVMARFYTRWGRTANERVSWSIRSDLQSDLHD